MNVPTEPGFYWAKYLYMMSFGDNIRHENTEEIAWEPVYVWRPSTAEGKPPADLCVSVTDVDGEKPLDEFQWGARIPTPEEIAAKDAEIERLKAEVEDLKADVDYWQSEYMVSRYVNQ